MLHVQHGWGSMKGCISHWSRRGGRGNTMWNSLRGCALSQRLVRLSAGQCYILPHETPKGLHRHRGGRNLLASPGRSRCAVLGDSPRRVGRQLFTDLIWQIVWCAVFLGRAAKQWWGGGALQPLPMPPAAHVCWFMQEGLGVPEESKIGSLVKRKASEGDCGLGGRGTVSSLFPLEGHHFGRERRMWGNSINIAKSQDVVYDARCWAPGKERHLLPQDWQYHVRQNSSSDWEDATDIWEGEEECPGETIAPAMMRAGI